MTPVAPLAWRAAGGVDGEGRAPTRCGAPPPAPHNKTQGTSSNRTVTERQYMQHMKHAAKAASHSTLTLGRSRVRKGNRTPVSASASPSSAGRIISRPQGSLCCTGDTQPSPGKLAPPGGSVCERTPPEAASTRVVGSSARQKLLSEDLVCSAVHVLCVRWRAVGCSLPLPVQLLCSLARSWCQQQRVWYGAV
jgi:hypothetical protein